MTFSALSLAPVSQSLVQPWRKGQMRHNLVQYWVWRSSLRFKGSDRSHSIRRQACTSTKIESPLYLCTSVAATTVQVALFYDQHQHKRSLLG